MYGLETTTDNIAPTPNPLVMHRRIPREYQLEMLDASLKQNIIVAMDTGSGKTQIAVMRIKEMLDNGPPGKLIWFMAPTVALCSQQHEVLTSEISSVKIQVLTGQDNVDRWTQQSEWNAVLRDVRVVVSTYAILADALTHGFVRMEQLSLLIFDEAHHCMRRHPANKIMQHHYHANRRPENLIPLPRILGLTASPIVRSNLKELRILEANLDATCKTPRVHRAELLQHVRRPHLERIRYTPFNAKKDGLESRLVHSLSKSIADYTAQHHQLTRRLCQHPSHEQLNTEIATIKDTPPEHHLHKLKEKSTQIYQELGAWGADYFIGASVDQLRNSIGEEIGLSLTDKKWRTELLEALSTLETPEYPPDDFNISPKVQVLVEFLQRMDSPQFSGLIFVQRRATVSVLTKLLTIHPATKGRFQCSAYVGWSSSNKRREGLGDLLARPSQKNTLAEFQSGQRNLIITTDVLEEGLDVSACRLVICFDKPANLKSFIQRRGRARHQDSTFAIMSSTEDDAMDVASWEKLEQTMIAAYQDEQFQRLEAQRLEGVSEEVPGLLQVPLTGAVLSVDDAMQHLSHFCNVLPRQDHIDNRPTFSFEEKDGLIRGTVQLPSAVDPAVRRTRGRRWWRTERAASREAAFEAYRSLWEHGLLNNNLLPLIDKPDPLSIRTDTLSAEISTCAEQFDPWSEVAEIWSQGSCFAELYKADLNIAQGGIVNDDLSVTIVVPKSIVLPHAIPLYWDDKTTLVASFSSLESLPCAAARQISLMRDITALLLQARTSKPSASDRDFVVLCIPQAPQEELEGWNSKFNGTMRLADFYAQHPHSSPLGIIRNPVRYNEPQLFRKWVLPEQSEDQNTQVECHSIPRRRNFLQRGFGSAHCEETQCQTQKTPKVDVIPMASCTLSRLPASKAMIGLFLPAILSRMETLLVAERLNSTVLDGVGIRDLDHVLTAVTTPLCQADRNYQRYEFFGDAVLKFVVSCQLFHDNPTWHEGYLSAKRDQLINNERLARSALDTGLDHFVITTRFTPRKWEPPTVCQKLNRPTASRRLSLKVLADVVEALIGAAYMDGGLIVAQKCIYRFLPRSEPFTDDISSSPGAISTSPRNGLDRDWLTPIIGYEFKNLSWVTEALTHPSMDYDMTSRSYQRLEYLGDAILDMVVVSLISAHPIKLSQGQMTMVKHALVNANLLGFLCMELGATEEWTELVRSTGQTPLFAQRQEQIRIWQFLRFGTSSVKDARDACLERHQMLRLRILASMDCSPDYPWELLARLHPDKFMSDVVESILGAIFVDSAGNLGACQIFLEKLGLVTYLNRLLNDGINVKHPRSRAQDLVKFQGTLVFKPRRIDVTGAPATYRSSVVLGEEELASIEGCGSSEEADIRIAHVVIDGITKAREESPGLSKKKVLRNGGDIDCPE